MMTWSVSTKDCRPGRTTIKAHVAHRERLRQHIQDLHAHLERLKTRDQ